jgi:hypothetical protein
VNVFELWRAAPLYYTGIIIGINCQSKAINR